MQFTIKIILLVLIILLGGASFISAAIDNGGGASYVKIQISPDNVLVGQEIFVHTKIKSGGGAYLSGCEISFGDGTGATGFCKNLKREQLCTENFSRSYNNPNDYTIRVSCTQTGMAGTLKDKAVVKVSKEPEPSSLNGNINPLKSTTLEGIASFLTDLVFYILSGLTVLFIIIGGFFILTAGGSSERLNKGKKIILFTIIGFTIMALAVGIRALIYKILGINL